MGFLCCLPVFATEGLERERGAEQETEIAWLKGDR